MSGEIATAYVRIRPNMSGFKAATESGVRESFKGIAEIVGVAFGAKQTFDFVKDIVTEAASVQKAVEGIRASFGDAGETVVRFGETGAAALGISATAADTVSARFGILFRNLGIGERIAAGMTIGWQKLAGSLAAIRGVSPTDALDAVTLAAAGNTRGLRQLGISIDQGQVKIAAFKLGLIASIKDGITPAIRAQAIYALATANLGTFQEQARKHAGDLSNVQRRLSAEWSNAKGIIGDGLLPVFAQYARQLEKWLKGMERSGALQRDFNKIADTAVGIIRNVASAIRVGWKIFETATGWVGGTKKALELFIAVIAVRKIHAIATAIRVDLIANGIQAFGKEAFIARTEYVGAMTTMEIATLGLSATIKGALISTGIGAIAVAVGLLAVEIINHWSTVKRWFVEFGHWLASHAKQIFMVPIVGPIIALVVVVVKNFDKIRATVAAFAHFFGTVFVHPVAAVKGLFNELGDVISGIFGGLRLGALKTASGIIEPFTHLPGFLGGGKFRGIQDWIDGQVRGLDVKGIGKKVSEQLATDFHHRGDVLPAAKELGKKVKKSVVDGLSGTDTAIGDVATKTVSGLVNNVAARVNAAVSAAKKNLDEIGQKLADSVNKILDKLGLVGGSLAGSPQAVAFKKLKDLIASGAPEFDIARTSKQLSSALANVGKTSARDTLKKQFADLTNDFNKGAISVGDFHKKVAGLLAKNHVTYKQAGKVLGSAFADGYRAQVSGLFAQAKAIAAVPAKFRVAGGGGGEADIKIIRPLDVMRSENAKYAKAAERQRERQIKAGERAARAAEKTAAQLKAINATKVGKLPGAANKKAKSAAASGVQP